ESHQLEKICIVARDITPQKNFELKTLELLRDMTGLIENANAVIFGIDTSGYITEWNSESVRLTGDEKREVYAQHLNMVFGKKKEEEVTALLQDLATGEGVANIEVELLTRFDDPLTVLLNTTPRLNASGHIVGTLFVGQDITEFSAYKNSL